MMHIRKEKYINGTLQIDRTTSQVFMLFRKRDTSTKLLPGQIIK